MSKPDPGIFVLGQPTAATTDENASESSQETYWTDKQNCIKTIANLSATAHEFFQALRQKNPSAVLWTPMVKAFSLDHDVFLKLENEQCMSSFKVRGAINSVHRLQSKHVVTASTGNHALAVAHASNLFQLKSTIFVPKTTSSDKLSTLKRFTRTSECDIQVVGDDCLQAELAASSFAQQNSHAYISPYNHELVIAGQGTIAFEIMDHFSKCETSYAGAKKCCYVTVGGGGLISGIAAVLKAYQPNEWRIVACLPQNSAVMFSCVKAGRVVQTFCEPTISDGSAGDIEDGAITIEACKHLVDAWAIVTEAEIHDALHDAIAYEHKLLEGAAGVAIAGCDKDFKWRQENCCAASVVIACGGNIGFDIISRLLTRKKSYNLNA